MFANTIEGSFKISKLTQNSKIQFCFGDFYFGAQFKMFNVNMKKCLHVQLSFI